MCHFVTVIAASDDVGALRSAMERHGRAAEPIDNPSIRGLLRPGERQYLTTRGHCDCGTVLAARRTETAEAFETRLARQASRLARRGWSEAKIARTLEDRRKAAERPDGGGGDCLEMWAAALRHSAAALGLASIGLFVRSYRGSIADEAFAATRRELPPTAALTEDIASMREDEVTMFTLG